MILLAPSGEHSTSRQALLPKPTSHWLLHCLHFPHPAQAMRWRPWNRVQCDWGEQRAQSVQVSHIVGLIPSWHHLCDYFGWKWYQHRIESNIWGGKTLKQSLAQSNKSGGDSSRLRVGPSNQKLQVWERSKLEEEILVKQTGRKVGEWSHKKCASLQPWRQKV